MKANKSRWHLASHLFRFSRREFFKNRGGLWAEMRFDEADLAVQMAWLATARRVKHLTREKELTLIAQHTREALAIFTTRHL